MIIDNTRYLFTNKSSILKFSILSYQYWPWFRPSLIVRLIKLDKKVFCHYFPVSSVENEHSPQGVTNLLYLCFENILIKSHINTSLSSEIWLSSIPRSHSPGIHCIGELIYSLRGSNPVILFLSLLEPGSHIEKNLFPQKQIPLFKRRLQFARATTVIPLIQRTLVKTTVFVTRDFAVKSNLLL